MYINVNTIDIMAEMCGRDLQSVEDAVNEHKVRDSKMYPHGPFPSARSSVRNLWSGLKHRVDDKEEVASLNNKVSNCEQIFHVSGMLITSQDFIVYFS